MFDGKMLRGETGMPMRRKLFANSSLAEAEPEPLTLANLMTKSLTASILFIALGGLLLPVAAAAGAGVGHLEQELLRSEEHTSELQSHSDLVCRLLLEKKKE